MRKFYILILLTVAVNASAQNDILLTQQWLSRINQNPAATGNSDYIDVFMLVRQQWAGFENAPSTQALNIHNYFHKIHSGIGLTAIHDETGIGNKTVNFKMAYARHINLSHEWLLSMGLSAGIMQNSFDPSLHFYPNPDPVLSSAEKTDHIKPDFDFGVELTSQSFTFGLSVTHITSSPNKTAAELKLWRQFYGYASYRRPLNSMLDIMAGVRGTTFQKQYFADFSVTGLLLKKYWAGLMFRPDNAVAGMIGARFGFIRLGYSYDYSIGSAASLARNSHEVMISLRIGKPKATFNTKSPRFIEE